MAERHEERFRLQTYDRFQASVFVNAEHITPTGRNSAALVSALADDSFLPTLVQEIGQDSLRSRMAFETENGERRLTLLGSRLDYNRFTSAQPAAAPDAFVVFCDDAAAKLVAVLQHFQLQPHRLAAVQEGRGSQLSPTQWQRVTENLFKLPSIYREHAPVEWDWSCVTRIEKTFGKCKEPLNYVTALKRPFEPGAPSVQEPSMTDMTGHLRLNLDINSLPTNPLPRFDIEDVNAFFVTAPTWHGELAGEIIAFIEEKRDGLTTRH